MNMMFLDFAKIATILILLALGGAFGNDFTVRRETQEQREQFNVDTEPFQMRYLQQTGNTSDDPEPFLLCRQQLKRPNFGLKESTLNYQKGEPVYSKLDVTTGTKIVTDVSTTLEKIVNIGTNVEFLDKALEISGYLKTASSALQIFTHWFGKTETDPTKTLIKNEFDKTNQKIYELSFRVTEGFDDIRQDFADNTLDTIMSPLQAIDYAYRSMIEAFNVTDSVVLKQTYTATYRYVP